MPMNKTPKVTIKDIARICNVSTQTISRVINHRPDVSDETRALVEKTIEETGYKPSALARSLVQQRSYTLGVILAGLKYVGVSQTLNGIAAECEASNYALFVKELPRFDSPDIVPVIESLMTQHVEGIIYAAPDLNENVKLVQSQLPAQCPPIVFLKCLANPNYTTISIDNYGGARKAVDYLISLGRRHIGLITGPMEWLESRQRKQGWTDALKAHGILPAAYKWAVGNWSSSSGESAFVELLQKYPKMDGLFCSNDQMCLGVLHYANANGIKVPQDLAIIGFDDLSEAAYYSPALTTVTHPLRELGGLAVKKLLAQIEGEILAHEEIVLPTELIIRNSTP